MQLFTFTQSKIENLILSFLIWNFAIEYISFSKEKDSEVFFLLFARGKSHRKKQRQAKKWYNGKAFYYKAGLLF